MMLPALLLAAVVVLPSDRMAMADRLFDRGDYATAQAEYTALKGVDGVEEDELLYRLAECARALKDSSTARQAYGELLARHPVSRHALRARLQHALLGTGDEKRGELKLLDSDQVPAAIRAAALYHLGVLTGDAAVFERSVSLDPQGPYACYARFRHAAIISEDADPAVRRSAIGELMGIARGNDRDLAREAIYLAATRSYGDARYAEASLLFARFLKSYPADSRAPDARTMLAWSDYLTGKYAAAAALCGEGETDDFAYLRAACALAAGDRSRAHELMTRYLEDYPQGRYRAAVELPLARMAFEAAEKGGDAAQTIAAAKRSVALSKSSTDRLRLAWAYEKGGLVPEAVAEYQGVARDFPSTDDAAEALFRKAMLDLRAQRWSAAELSLAEALATGRNPARRAETLYWRGIAAERMGHTEESGRFLSEALALGLSLDAAREARLLLADAAFKAGRRADAKARYMALVAEGACARMSAARINSVGRFLLESTEGEGALMEVKTCARALIESGGTPEWRQAGHALCGAAEEAGGEFAAAIASYRACLAENLRTEVTREASLRLGILESKAGETSAADRTLKESLRLNSADAHRRAQGYLWLARNSETAGDFRSACAYATVVTTLFDDAVLAAEADRILKAHPEEAK
ncbi:MAG: tol-pal system YbgF family protein [Kiritimatiellia bacterium]